MKTKTEFTTVSDCFKSDSAYWGERGNWIVAYEMTRDADCLGRSNMRSFIKLLGGKGTEGAKGTQDISEHVAIEEARHWACGWIQRLIVDPSAADLVAIVQEANKKLEGYPVVDEDDWSELEWNEYCEFFERDCRGEFRRGLKEFELKDSTLDRIESAPVEVLQTWFESQISSGEYHHDGYPNFSLAFDRATRDEVAQLLRAILYPV